MPFDARAELTPEAQRLLLKLKAADAMPAFRVAMKGATSPLVKAAKSAARNLPSGRSRYKSPGGSLRSAIANSIQSKTKFSARSVLALVKQVPSGGKSNLGTVLEGEKPWVHPTFGHGPEVDQEAHPFFYKTMEEHEPETTARVETVLEDFERRLS